MIGYLPLLKHGAHIDTISGWNIQRRDTGAVKDGGFGITLDLRGTSRAFQSILFGAGSDAVASTVFGDPSRAEEVLEHHTLFGIYTRHLEVSRTKVLADGLRSAPESRSTPRIVVIQNAGTRVTRNHRRSCPTCMELDIADQGFPSWWVLHYLPYFDHCPYHGSMLVKEQLRVVRANRLPTGKGTSCKSRAGQDSTGYKTYLDHWSSAMRNECPQIREAEWTRLVTNFTHSMGSSKAAISTITNTFKDLWGVHPKNFGRLISPNITPDFVSRQLQLQSSYFVTPERIALLGALEELGAIRTSEPQQIFRFHKRDDAKSEFADALAEMAYSRGLPGLLVPLLLQQGTSRAIGNACKIPRHHVSRFINELPDQTLMQLLRHFPPPRSSCVRRELVRRRVYTSQRSLLMAIANNAQEEAFEAEGDIEA